MQSIEEICKIYSKNIYKYLFCLTHSHDMSEELTQETMYRAIKNIHRIREPDKIENWLLKIAKNLWLQELQKKKKNISYNNEEILKKLQEDEDIVDRLIIQEQKKYINDKIKILDKISREVFYLRIIGDFRFRDIGEMLGKTENWARVTFYRAKQKIIKEVQKDEQKNNL